MLKTIKKLTEFTRNCSAASIIERNKKVRKQTKTSADSEYGWIDALKKPELIEKCIQFGLKKSHGIKMMKSKLMEIHAYQESLGTAHN